MSNYIIQSDLIVDLSLDEQENLTGGLCSKEDNKSDEDKPNGSSSNDQEDSLDKSSKAKYQFLVYRPIVNNPKIYVRAS
ncbi:hypothetical protein MEN41_10785 [Dolichospermum sp. ST_con]|nr:hypothetical protein [Dolichospermum sp. ST_con]MDD1417887.1 hypothetical protein [Dolichospermum sp. ST_sed1]MDD1423544.1 hypothetical protein [Dolichospermum sp. ST_sed9]MDD1431707.1 hypothetical protein [Dolichospermum sp. ST_sed6]MDD1437560.1 hypothetical protein [Dolichospermum sp. ST_sed10]MDD1440568.1 hypothetical protein [Dolichospermum sp. ST_sed3]MDD1449247.1 hypothetical protein [Dolichospermum sp. ST_sed8]MDD1453666.1 hypothetical protein [Dolichospermum sp. ST_sed7]MDD145938